MSECWMKFWREAKTHTCLFYALRNSLSIQIDLDA
jgi:hypothetical protein